MVELISIIVLVLSLIGMAVILYRRLPDLSRLPVSSVNLQANIVLKLKKGIGCLPVVKNFSYEMYLQKMLSRIRILTLKTDSKTSGWLERLRQKKNNKENGKNNDNYWEELKKAKDGK